MRWTVVLSGLVLASLAGAPAAAAGPVETRLRAEALMQEGRWQEARPMLEGLVAAIPTAEHTFRLGLCLLRLGEPERSAELLGSACAAEPDRHEWLDVWAESLAATGRADRALTALDRAIALADRPRYRYDRAMCALDLGRPEIAEGDLQRAVELAPRSTPALLQLASLLAATGREAAARELVDRLLALEPDHLEGHALAARLGLALGDPAAAAVHARRVLAAVPSHVAASYVLGRSLAALGDAAEAKRVLDRVRSLAAAEDRVDNLREWLAMEPADLEVRLELAGLLLDLGRTRDALTEIEIARTRTVDDPRPHHLLARVYEAMGATGQAARDRERAAALEAAR